MIRPASRPDVSFICSSWLKSFRDSAFAAGCPNSLYYYSHHKLLEVILPRAVVAVATDPSDPDLIVGWACAEGQPGALILHYVYVKHRFRGFGVARRLVEALLAGAGSPGQVFYTHLTRRGAEIARRWKDDRKEPAMAYNPYLLILPFAQGAEEVPPDDAPAAG